MLRLRGARIPEQARADLARFVGEVQACAPGTEAVVPRHGVRIPL